MTEILGKKIDFSSNHRGIESRGVCTMLCPSICKQFSAAFCKCSHSSYSHRGSGYSGHYNTQVHSNRTPNFG